VTVAQLIMILSFSYSGPEQLYRRGFWDLFGDLPPSINPTPRPYLRVTWRSVPWVTWEAVTGVERIHCRRFLRQAGCWGSTEAKVEGVVLRSTGVAIAVS